MLTTARSSVTIDWLASEYVHHPLGRAGFAFEVMRDRPKISNRSTRLGLISIKHTVLGSSVCATSATQPTASSRRVSEVEGLGVRTSPICVPALFIVPCGSSSTFSSNTNITFSKGQGADTQNEINRKRG